MMKQDFSIGTMPLYTNLERIERGLKAVGVSPSDAVRPEQLYPLDQWHYHGTEAIQTAAAQLKLTADSRVLEIGSGIGGPARYLAHTTGCHVTALELQPKLSDIALDLTQRCGLDSKITHLCADALSCPLPIAEFDAVVSWLALVHIPDRRRLVERLARVLRSGGACYIEDLYERAPFAPQDLQDVRSVVLGTTVTSIERYVDDLGFGGFVDVQAIDLTSDWAPYASDRLLTWRENHAAYAAVHGEGAYGAQELFFATITRLYEAGSLGGVRMIARVP